MIRKSAILLIIPETILYSSSLLSLHDCYSPLSFSTPMLSTRISLGCGDDDRMAYAGICRRGGEIEVSVGFAAAVVAVDRGSGDSVTLLGVQAVDSRFRGLYALCEGL